MALADTPPCLSAKDIQIIKSKYPEGVSSNKLADRLQVSPSTVLRCLRALGIEIKDNSQYKKYECNSRAFEDLDKETSYWIGFLLADGCVEPDNNLLALELAKKDVDALEKLKKFLNASHPIKPNESNDSYRISIIDENIVDDLRGYGVKYRKSGTADPQGIDNRPFWRGVIDGDGWISQNKGYPSLGLSGSKPTLKKYKQHVSKVFNCNTSIHHRKKDNYEFNLAGKQAAKVMRYLYKDADIYLDRKYNLARSKLNRDKYNHLIEKNGGLKIEST